MALTIGHTVRQIARRLLKPPLHKLDMTVEYEVLGTEYGGWPLIHGTLDDRSVIYSFGVGEDVSFDRAAIERLGCRVRAFDPTPRSCAWIETQDLPPEFHFHPIGISDVDDEVSFFEPSNPSHVSFSDAPAATATGRSVTAPVRRLNSIMADLGDQCPDILKMDVEGFEYRVITDILETDIRPRFWLIEFHHGMYGKTNDDTRTAVTQLRGAGYRLFYVSPTGREYGFLLPKAGRDASLAAGEVN